MRLQCYNDWDALGRRHKNMEKYCAVMLVSPMGHDVNRICSIVRKWLTETGIFKVVIAGT